MATLKDLKPGECGRISGCVGDGAILQRLCEMGLVAGTLLRVIRLAPLGDPMEVEVRNFHLSLRKAEAALVEVEPL